MTIKYSNGMYKTTSKKQDKLSQDIFRSFHALGYKVTMGCSFNQVTGDCMYEYEDEGKTILLLWLTYNGESKAVDK